LENVILRSIDLDAVQVRLGLAGRVAQRLFAGGARCSSTSCEACQKNRSG